MSIVLTLQPDETSGVDTYINSGAANTNYATSGSIVLAGSSGYQKGLLKFDLSSIPAGAVIESAVLTIRQDSDGTSGGHQIRLYRSLVDWFESGSTWNHRNTSGAVGWAGGAGGAAGSEYSASSFASTPNVGFSTVDLNFTVTSEIDAYVNGGITNRGWWIIRDGTVLATTVLNSSAHVTAATRPKLVVTYFVPSPRIGNSAGVATVSGELSDGSLQYSDLTPSNTTVEDVRIVSQVPTANFGAETQVLVGRDPELDHDKGLIKFDLENFRGANLISATLTLYCTGEDSTTNRDISIHRSLVQWYEGNLNNTVPGAGVNASTWNHRNANGSVAWAGGAGGAAGSDYVSTASDTTTITAPGQYYEFDVTADVENFLDGTATNHGWWLLVVGTVASNRKYFASSEHATVAFRPQLSLVYRWQVGTSAGSSTVSGALLAPGNLSGASQGAATVSGRMITNEFVLGASSGTAIQSGTLHADGALAGASSGTSGHNANIVGEILLAPGSSEGSSTASGDIKGQYELEGNSAASSSTAATGNFSGSLRGSSHGVSANTASGYAKAIGKARVVNCYPTPLLYLTDGATKTGGQLNILNFLTEGSGYKLQNWRPAVAQYKDGGRFSSSPLSQGRRLTFRSFDNAVEIFDLSAVAADQNMLIDFQQQLVAFQEAAADYWISNFAHLPVYLVAKAALEDNPRYAIVHMISVPELENPYRQPFFQRDHAAFQSITVRVERGHWTDSPPGDYQVVNASSQRSWTVSGWVTGS